MEIEVNAAGSIFVNGELAWMASDGVTGEGIAAMMVALNSKPDNYAVQTLQHKNLLQSALELWEVTIRVHPHVLAVLVALMGQEAIDLANRTQATLRIVEGAVQGEGK